MGDNEYPFPVVLRWTDDPQSLKKLKNKLLLYFQKRSESNGGECEIRDTDCSRGHILIHFKDRKDRDGVLQKDTHDLKLPGGKKMRLDIRSAEADNSGRPEESPMDSGASLTAQPPAAEATSNRTPNVTRDPSSSQVLIQNLRDSYSNEMLNLLVENISEKSEDTDFNVERIPDIQSAVITFTCDIDIVNFVEKFSRHPRVQTSNMTAKLLEETRTIRVEGLPPNTCEDYISLYFENPKHGVPGSTEDVLAISDEGAAMVTFSSVEAAKIILGKKHQFGKKEVSVFPYYPSQDIVLYGKQRPQIQKPEPLTFPVSPYILEFILRNTECKDSMEKTIRTHTCEIEWPDLLCPNPVITLCFPDALSTHLRALVKLVPTWKDKVQTEFSLLISKYKVVEYRMDRLAWDAVREHSSSSAYSGVLIKPDFASGKVFLAGLFKDVTRIDPSFRKLVEETTKQMERKSQSQTDTLAMSPGLYQIMCNSGLQKKILDQVPELKIDYDVPRKEIRLSGLKEEVLTAKCEILNIKQEMKCKSIQINPHLVQFLRSTDNEELSGLLFVRHNINALLEIDNDSVKLTAYSRKDLTEAEEQINQELLCKQIFVEEMSVLRCPEWRSLYSYLLETFNADKSTILVLESPSGAKEHVVIAGLSSNVQKCHQNVNDFLDKNTPMEKNIKVKKLVVLQFFREEKKQVLDELKNNKLSVAIRNKNIRLKGPKVYVTEAYSRVSDVLGSLYSDTLCIDKPGAKKLYLSNEDLYVTMAKNKFRCLLRLQKEEEEETSEDEEMEEPQCRVTLPNGVVISVYKGDLCRLNVDVVVNAANEDLQHVGGLALALLKAAGQTLQDDSDHIIKTGRLTAGESVVTASGRLPCKQVIHTVGPRWNSTSTTKCERLLQKAITSSLELAEEYCHSSIAIPAISSGIFGCPVDKSAENIVKAIKQYMDGKPKGSPTIREVHLVDTNENTVRIFASTLKKEFGEEEAESSPKYRKKGAERIEKIVPKEKVYEPKTSANQMMTKENIVIGIREGLIQDATTDVVVNSVGKDLQLSNGKVSQALLNKAGNRLQQRLRDVSSGVQVDEGSVFITDGCNLTCKAVIHVVVPQWNEGKGSSEKIFRKVVASCLCESEKNKLRSITFPAIGTGAPGFPKRAVASIMFEEILKFSSKVKPQNLREVTFILHPSDRETLTEFSKELSSQMDKGATVRPRNDISSPGTSQSSQVVAASGPGFFGTVSSPMTGTYEIKVGSVTYQVKSGDITKEDTDIIVNSTDGTFTMRTGVSGAILSAAGQSVVDECTRLGSQNDKEYIVTQSGNLRCKKILHKIGTNSAGGIKTFICEALAVCAQLQATSVAFPAIGTGMGNVSASAVADSILESVADFGSSSQSVQTVKVVIFQKQMLNDFHSSMKKKEGGSAPRQEGILSKVKKSFFENVKSPAQDVYEMKIGSVTYQVKTGDITKETCDVIINSTNSTFNLKTGVSKAILEAAGPNIENECAMLGTRPNKGYVVTQGGNLHCKNIIHVVSQTKPHLIGQCVTTALYECEKQQATSVAFPAMGTGSGSVPSAAVANAMIDAVVDFLKSKSIVNVQNVTVVIFQPQMLTDFHDSMKKKEPPAPPKHWFSWSSLTSLFSSSQSDKSNVVKKEEEEEEEPKVFELRENIEPAIIHLCAESQESVKAASDWLREMITKDQRDNTITDDFIQYLDKKDQDVLAQLQRENRVHLILDSQWSTIKVEGRTKDVLEVSNKIQDIIKDIRDKKTREHEAELCSNVVEWGYYQGTNFIPFDKMTNLELEKAKNDDLSCLNIDINGVKYTAIIELKSARDPKGNTITLQRNPKNAESLLIPPYWDAMDNTQLKVVPLNASSPDYSEVQDLFTKTCPMRIIKIERIQNKPLYQNYRIKKDSIDAKNRSKTNEERLFHGTDIETTKNINGNGFNRAYAGSNAAKLGKGTYFAVEAIYSADDTYSKPDANAYKYMYLARVLTGVSCVGNSSMIAPPAKSTSNPTDLYDSVTDSVSTPTVFVIFSDIQAYPEYLITFTK